jgi:hypothetical protein
MLKTVRARITQGRIEPLVPLPFEEGAEVDVTAAVGEQPTPDEKEDPTQATAGAWDGLLDCEEFENDIYESRLRNPRPSFSL